MCTSSKQHSKRAAKHISNSQAHGNIITDRKKEISMTKRLFSCYLSCIDAYGLEWAESAAALASKNYDAIEDITDKPLKYISRTNLEKMRNLAGTDEEKHFIALCSQAFKEPPHNDKRRNQPITRNNRRHRQKPRILRMAKETQSALQAGREHRSAGNTQTRKSATNNNKATKPPLRTAWLLRN